MMNNWTDQLANLRTGAKALAQANPAVVQAYAGLNRALGEGQALDAKTRELIALAVAVTTRCDGCIASHAAAARQAGASQQEVAEALGTAIALNAGAAYVFGPRAGGLQPVRAGVDRHRQWRRGGVARPGTTRRKT